MAWYGSAIGAWKMYDKAKSNDVWQGLSINRNLKK